MTTPSIVRVRCAGRHLAAAALLLLSGGCCKLMPSHCPKPTPPPCVPPSVDVDRSLVVHDPANLATPFGFRRTVEQIIATSGGAATTAEAFVQTMLDSFNAASFVNPDSGKAVPVDLRPGEAGLSAAQLLDPTSPAMVPVGLFNRLDLAPDDGSNCGEYRIVYAMPGGAGRFFIIFESKLPNPAPGTGLAGCQPVAKFWADLTTDPDPIAALEKLYYLGTAVPGFGPVVTHANYGVPLGQVRTNLFVTPRWMLREHRTALDTSARPILVADTVKENPLVELYQVPASLPGGFTSADQAAFRTHFLGTPTCNLLRPDRANPSATEFDVVNGIGAGFDNGWNEFQSVSDSSDDPAAAPDPALIPQITARLAALSTTTVSEQQLLSRAGTMTCGGCHQFSNGVQLNAGGHHWPPSIGFVHIDETANLSTALTSFFLPRRKQILERFVCDPTAETKPTPQCPGATGGTGGGGYGGASTATPEPAPAGIDPRLAAELRRGRALASLVKVDDARLSLIAAARRAKAGPKSDRAGAQREARAAAKALEASVRAARTEERAKGGAFVPVRRTH
jgi:hypothetical protein